MFDFASSVQVVNIACNAAFKIESVFDINPFVPEGNLKPLVKVGNLTNAIEQYGIVVSGFPKISLSAKKEMVVPVPSRCRFPGQDWSECPV